MNFQIQRIQSFYLMKTFSTVEKHFISKKGFFILDNQLKCYKCETTYRIGPNSMDVVNIHECGNRIKNNNENVEIPSPYAETGAINVQNNLNYEEFRYATFTKWSMGSMIKESTLELAAAGFYYAVSPDTLKCFYCKTTVEAMVLPNRTIAEHKKSKKCLQRKFSLQIRIHNLSQDIVTRRPTREGRRGPTVFASAEDAGPSRLCTNCNSPTIDSPETSGPLQRAFNEFLNKPDKKAIYTKALNLGFDPHLVNTIIKRRLQFETTVDSVEQLIELCLTFQRNSNTAQTIAQIIEDIERETECKICMSSKIDVIFMPCHHVVACFQCGQRVTSCPMCCTPIAECSKIYF